MDEITKLLEVIGNSIVENIKNQLKAINLSDSRIINNISYTINSQTDTLTINMPDYWIFIENGRKPGTPPPVSVIIEWIKRKRLNVKSINSAAYAISRAIGRRGLKPRPFLEGAMKQSEQQINTFLDISLNDILDNELKKIIKI